MRDVYEFICWAEADIELLNGTAHNEAIVVFLYWKLLHCIHKLYSVPVQQILEG